MEQMLNAVLAEQRGAHPDMLRLAGEAMAAFSRWVQDIADRRDTHWSAGPFRASAEAWRNQAQYLALALPQAEQRVESDGMGDPAPAATVVETADEAAPALDEIALPEPTHAETLAEAVTLDDTSHQPPEGQTPAGVEGLVPASAEVDFSATVPFADAPTLDADRPNADASGDAPLPSMFEEIDFDSLMAASSSAQAEAAAAVVANGADLEVEAAAAPVDPAPLPSPAPDEVSALFDGLSLDLDAHPSQEVESITLDADFDLDTRDAPQIQAEPVSDDAGLAVVQDEVPPTPETETHAETPTDGLQPPVVDEGAEPQVVETVEESFPGASDEQIRVIGDLRIGIKLYNVYLNEADEWSRRLCTELAEWALERHQPVPDQAEALAHSLAGSSATVGFQSLSDIARALEHAIESIGLHQQAGWAASADKAPPFVDASEDIRRLLHQFAAGFLKEPSPELMAALYRVVHEPVPEGLPPEVPEAQSDPLFEAPPTNAPTPMLAPAGVEVAAFSEPSTGFGGLHESTGPAAGPVQDIDDDIDALDTIDVDLFPIFADEALELLPRLGGALRQWVARPDNGSARSEVLRNLHTLKGSARLAGALRLGEMAHRMETAAEPLGSGVERSADLEPLQSAFDAISARFDVLRRTDAEPQDVIQRAPEQAPPDETGEVPEAVAAPVALPVDAAAPTGPAEGLAGMTLPQVPALLQARAGAAVRVRPELLDRLVNQTGEVMITRSRMESELVTLRGSLKDLTGNLDRLRGQLRDIERQRDRLRTRMGEGEGRAERLYRVVRQASKETGKQVRLDIVGGNIEMDRGVLDRMTAAFEHLLRNSVVHGIEPTETRLALGKAAEGHIEIHLAQELNDVSVVFRDDGAGLDLARLREKGVAQGLVPAGTQLSDDEAAHLVFTPGLSTATEITPLPGRGVGMDVVRNDVVALGGRIETSTRAGQGTSFKLVLPLTTAVTQVVMVRAGGLTFGVPSNLVQVMRRLSSAELDGAYAKGSLTVAGEEVPFYWSGALLQSSAQSQEAKGRALPVVIFRSAAQRVAMHVDQVLGNQEVVVKNLGPQLSRLPGLAGMSVLASGAVALIYNPVALATVYGTQVHEWIAQQQRQAPEVVGEASAPVDAALSAVPLVLVVDDSITVRRVTQRLLQREGYRVSMAADGLQALERLQQERPTVVLSDIEMPRMDGFDLVRNIRSDPRLSDLPVIMITSRIAEKHREHARELGVDHYLGKPYSEDELLALIAHYTQIAAQA